MKLRPNTFRSKIGTKYIFLTLVLINKFCFVNVKNVGKKYKFINSSRYICSNLLEVSRLPDYCHCKINY